MWVSSQDYSSVVARWELLWCHFKLDLIGYYYWILFLCLVLIQITLKSYNHFQLITSGQKSDYCMAILMPIRRPHVYTSSLDATIIFCLKFLLTFCSKYLRSTDQESTQVSMSFTSPLVKINNTFIRETSQDPVFMMWTGKTLLIPLTEKILKWLARGLTTQPVTISPPSGHCCWSLSCESFYETNLGDSSQKRKGGGEASFWCHIPKTLAQGKSKWRALRQAVWQPGQT